MAIIETTVEELVEREDRALERVVELARSVDPSLPTGDGSWTAHDVLAHLVTVIRRYTNPDVRLAATAREVDEVNADELAGLADTPMGTLAEQLVAGHRAYQDLWSKFPLDAELRFHAGLRFDAASLRANWLSELLVHGRDVAVATGRDWPLDDREGLLALRVAMRALPGYVKADDGPPLRVALRVAGGTPQRIELGDGTATVTEGEPATADLVLSGSPVAAALLFYGRLSADQAETAGLVVEGGRQVLERFLARREAP